MESIPLILILHQIWSLIHPCNCHHNHRSTVPLLLHYLHFFLTFFFDSLIKEQHSFSVCFTAHLSNRQLYFLLLLNLFIDSSVRCPEERFTGKRKKKHRKLEKKTRKQILLLRLRANRNLQRFQIILKQVQIFPLLQRTLSILRILSRITAERENTRKKDCSCSPILLCFILFLHLKILFYNSFTILHLTRHPHFSLLHLRLHNLLNFHFLLLCIKYPAAL